MAKPALTPDSAVTYLADLSADIRAAAVLGENGEVAAQKGFDESATSDVRALVGDLFDAAAVAAGDAAAPDQFEVALPDGSVYAVRDGSWTVTVIAGRYALSSLMFFDLRMVLRDLAGARAAA